MGATLCLLATTVCAQEDSTRPTSLNEVVVTATRFAKKMGETGKVINVISRQDLERNTGKDLAQVLNDEGGMLINSAYSNPGKDKSVFLRGAKADYTVILLNGIPVSDPSGVGGAFDLRMFSVDQIERIEILKGAQSTIYGSDAVAGVINIITKKANNKPFGINAGYATGSYQTHKVNVAISGSAEGNSYNIGFTHFKTTGFSEAEDTALIKSFDRDGYTQNALSADFNVHLAKGLHVKPYFRYTLYKGGFDGGSFTDGPGYYHSQLLTTGTQAQCSFKNGTVTAFYDYDEISRYFTDEWGEYPYSGNKKTLEVFAHYTAGKHWQFLAGMHYNTQQMHDKATSPIDPSASFTSPYASVFVKDLAGFNLELGARYNHHNKYGDNFTYSINPSFTVNQSVKLFVNYATAFKAPTLTSLYGVYGSNPALKPEESATVEAGTQASIFHGKADLRAVYFQRETKDIIIYGPDFTMVNLDTQKDHGVEIEPALYINPKLRIKVSYAYVNGEVTTRANNKDTTYSNLIRRPKHSVGAGVSYQFTKQFSASTQINHYSKRNDLFYNNATYVQEPVILGAYTLWNIYAEYKIFKNRLKFFADAKNICNSRFTEIYGYTTQRFNLLAGFNFTF